MLLRLTKIANIQAFAGLGNFYNQLMWQHITANYMTK